MTIFATNSAEISEIDSSLKGRVRSFLRNGYLDIQNSFPKIKNETDFVRCLYCHFVCDDNLKNFEEIIRQLSRNGKFISSKQLHDHITGKVELSGRNFHLSFDDGLKNNFTNAVPILSKYSVPATFFVPSGYIGSTYEKASEFCIVKTRYRNVLELMEWEDLRELVNMGFEIGSHTVSHSRLSVIDDDMKLKYEIISSKEHLEEKLGVECRYFSWPYGRVDDINARSIEVIKDAGYALSFGGYRGSIVADTQVDKVPRHHFEPSWPLHHVDYFARGNHEKT